MARNGYLTKPAARAKAKVKRQRAIGKARTRVVGPGVLSDAENKMLNKLVRKKRRK